MKYIVIAFLITALMISAGISITLEATTEATTKVTTEVTKLSTVEVKEKKSIKEKLLAPILSLIGTRPAVATGEITTEMSVSEIRKLGILPSNLKEGTELFGFRYYRANEDSYKKPGRTGWFKLVEAGLVFMEFDSKSEKTNYSVWLQATVSKPWFKLRKTEPGPTGNKYFESTKADLDNLISLNQHRYKSIITTSEVGDISVQADGEQFTVYTARGPFVFMLSVTPYLRIADGSTWLLDEKFAIDEKTTRCESPELIDPNILVWRSEAKMVALKLMRDYLNKFEKWYQFPTAKGSGLRGYYWPNMTGFLLKKEELPKGIKIEGKPKFKHANPATINYKAAGKYDEKYQITILAKYPKESDKKNNAALEEAVAFYQLKVKALKKPIPLEIKGIDEAMRMSWRHKKNFEKIIFRRDNVIVIITGSNNGSKNKPPAFTKKIAQRIAKKIAGAGLN
ncbi:hypothetical protein ACFL52_02540 [Candidatus Margulisiibacteriota bacterium]